MKKFILPSNLDKRIATAARFFWTTRNNQIRKQTDFGIRDQGNRGAATVGKQLDGFVALIKYCLTLNGIPEESIFTDSCLELPGYYRPNKKWDLLVVDHNKLIAAAEFKSQTGPSFGNNFNNRTEEAMGSALDIWTAYREGVFGTQAAPWLGYFLLLEDCNKSNTPVGIRSPHFPVLNEFVNTSYKTRYSIFCRKLLLERQYNAVCFATTCKTGNRISCNFINDDLSYIAFIHSMLTAAVSQYETERGND